jgi:hypothetical protein
MTRAPIALGVAIAAAIAGLGASPAVADSHAEAVVLFDQGIKDMKAGQLDKACAELQSSLELVKDSGTKGALARCHGLAGRVATAWLLWRELADTAPTAELRTDAAAQARKLEPRLPRYTIKPAHPTPDLVVEINGRSVAVDVPVGVPLDPGKLTVTARRRDGRAVSDTWTHDYTAIEGETLDIEVPALALRAADPPVAPRQPTPDPELAGRRHRRHVVALVIGGVALGAAGGGAWFGLDARSTYDKAKQTCGGAIHDCADDRLAASQQLVKDARSSATRSTALFLGAGGVAVVAAIVWATAPSLERKPVAVVPTLGPGGVGLAVGGAF